MRTSDSSQNPPKNTGEKGASLLPTTINDLRDKEFGDEGLTQEEARALRNFDRYRLEHLKQATSEKDFHERFMRIQAKANVNSYREFLDPED